MIDVLLVIEVWRAVEMGFVGGGDSGSFYDRYDIYVFGVCGDRAVGVMEWRVVSGVLSLVLSESDEYV